MLEKEEVRSLLIKTISWCLLWTSLAVEENSSSSATFSSNYQAFIMFLCHTRNREVRGVFDISRPFSCLGTKVFPFSALYSSSENRWLKKQLRNWNRNYMRSLSSRTRRWVPVPQTSPCLFQRKHCFCQKTSSTGILLAAAAKGGSVGCATSAGN